MLRPRLTEVHETFTRGGPWVWIEKYTTWIFSWSSLNYRVGQKVTKFGIFRPRPPTFCSHARTRQNIVILKKNLLSADGCSTRVPGLVNFGLQTPEMAEIRHLENRHDVDMTMVLIVGEDYEMFMTRILNDTPKTTEQRI